MNCDGISKLSMVERLSVLIGFIYSAGPVLYFGFEPPLNILMIGHSSFTLVFNCAAFILWLCGMIKKKSVFLVASIICWGVPLSLWISFMFRLARELMIYGGVKEFISEDNYNIWVFPVTVLFLVLYFSLVLAYLILHRSIEISTSRYRDLRELNDISNNTLYWKCVAILAAWIIMAFINMNVFYYFPQGLFITGPIVSITLAVLVINFVFTVIWWRSVSKNSVKLISILWWGLIFAQRIIDLSLIYITSNEDKPVPLGIIAMIIIDTAVYSLAVKSYLSLKRANDVKIMRNYAEFHEELTESTQNNSQMDTYLVTDKVDSNIEERKY